MATFQEQMMTVVLPRIISGMNALKKSDADILQQIQDMVAELDDHVERLNMLESTLVHMQEKRRRGRPRAKKAQDPVAMVEQAAQEAQAPVV